MCHRLEGSALVSQLLVALKHFRAAKLAMLKFQCAPSALNPHSSPPWTDKNVLHVTSRTAPAVVRTMSVLSVLLPKSFHSTTRSVFCAMSSSVIRVPLIKSVRGASQVTHCPVTKTLA